MINSIYPLLNHIDKMSELEELDLTLNSFNLGNFITLVNGATQLKKLRFFFLFKF